MKNFHNYPASETRIMVSKVDNGKGNVGPNTNGYYDYFTYDLEMTWYDSNIHDGVTCNDYAKKGSTYGKCVETALKEKLLNWYDCLPPWFPENTSLTCEEVKPMKKGNKQSMFDAYNELYRLASWSKVFSSCLKPCKSMGSNLKEVLSLPNLLVMPVLISVSMLTR